MSGEKTASYAIRFDSNAVQTGREGADSLEQLKGAVGRSQDAVKTLNAAMRGLKGSSDEVKSAREQLKAQLEAEKGAITANTLALLKQGTTFEQLAAKEKAATQAAEKLRAEQEKAEAKRQAAETLELAKSLAAAGGPAVTLRDKVKGLGEAFSTTQGTMALLAGAASAVVVAVVAVTGALAAGAVALGKWILETSNAQRDMALMREAWTGSATNAQHLGNQLDALAKKVATPKEQLNELGGSLVRALSGTRVSGQGIVDTFNAVAQASAAMGDQAGKAIEDIITRSKQFGRVSINPFELQGTGIKQQDVAAELAKNLGVGVQQAQLALMQGRVKVDDAAKALRGAVEKRFGEINAKKLISIDSTIQKFKEKLASLTTGVNLEGLLRGLSKIADFFDTSTVSGSALKTIITTIGDAVGKAFSDRNIDKAKVVFQTAELAALKGLIVVYKIDNAIGKVFGKDWKGSLFGGALENAEKTAAGLADILDKISHTLDAISGGGASSTKKKTQAFGSAGPEDMIPQGRKLGGSLTDGVAAGVKAGAAGPVGAVQGLAADMGKAFAEKLEIHSPSRVFERHGEQLPAGVERGVDKGGARAQQAVQRMAPKPPAPAATVTATATPGAGGAGKAGPRELHVHFHLAPGAGAGDVQKQLSAPSFLQNLTRAVEEALTQAGLPTQMPATP